MTNGAKDIAISAELTTAIAGFLQGNCYAIILYFVRVSFLTTILTLVGPKINATIGGI
jgi:hypothetical protein